MKIYPKLVFLILLTMINPSYASFWENMWQTPDHQAQIMMEKGMYDKAKDTFKNENWRAAAAFRAKDYQQAVELYSKSETLNGYYNKANALAYLGKLQAAISAYNQAIKINPHDKDALYNRKIIQDMLKDQKKNDKKNEENKDNQQNEENKNKQQPKSQKNDTNKNEQSEQKNNDELKSNEQKKAKIDKKSSAKDKQEMKDQWLRLIPDDPGGLLREKFRRDYLRSRGE